MSAPARSEGRERWIAACAAARAARPAGPAWLERLQARAAERFAETGFPTTRDEAWRYTNLGAVEQGRFEAHPVTHLEALTPGLFEQLTFEPWDCNHLVFLNGRFAPGLSRTSRLPDGVRLTSLAEAVATEPGLVEPHLGRLADARGRSVTDLNTALMSDGLFLRVPRGTLVQEPIHALFVTMANGAPAMAHPRNLIVVEEGAQASIVESHAGVDGGMYLTNGVTEIAAADGAVVDHVRVVRETAAGVHLSHLETRLGRSAAVSSHVVSLGGGLVRHDVDAVLDGEGAECTLNGLYVLDGAQHVDNHTLIDHARPNGTSRELYKGVLDGRSRGVFDGTIIVRPDAQKSDAKQVNRNLLLSEDALADSKPTLQIHADDVKCSHAATIGQIEENALFYLRARALSEETARLLLVQAFVSDILGRIRIGPVRAGLECLLFTRLPRHHAARENP